MKIDHTNLLEALKHEELHDIPDGEEHELTKKETVK